MPALVIMAAGLGTRYKGGIKVLTPVGPSGEYIMDYSVYDAVRAGFSDIIFVIRREIETDFKESVIGRMSGFCTRNNIKVDYVFQDMNDIPAGTVPEGRVKPWGTCHAVLAARGLISEPFCVINADDYYGTNAFRLIAEFLKSHPSGTDFCMAGFRMVNTLSEFGGVTRGICALDFEGHVSKITETRHIMKDGSGAIADGKPISPNAVTSMNMWGFTADMMQLLESGFTEFLDHLNDPLTDEFLLPIYVNRLIERGRISVKALETPDKWFGVTYAEDHAGVVNAICGLVREGVYPENLYN